MSRPVQRLQLDGVGDPLQVLSLVTIDDPTPGPGQVLVEVDAAPINPSDLLYVAGRYFLSPHTPSGAGAEGAGRVTAVGPDVDDTLTGRRVLLLPTYRHATWATHLLSDATDVVPVPEDADVLQLAMLGINPMTALQLLRGYGNPESPQRWIGQSAGNSAVGEYLVKLSRHFGYQTLSVVRRQAAADQVRSWGGDRVVLDGDVLAEDLTSALEGAKLDIAVDSVGGSVSTLLAHHLDYTGTLVSYGTQSEQPPTIAKPDLYGNHAQLTGFWLTTWLNHTARPDVVAAYGELAGLVADGTLSASIQRTFPLEDWPTALGLAQESGRTGKILFTPSASRP